MDEAPRPLDALISLAPLGERGRGGEGERDRTLVTLCGLRAGNRRIVLALSSDDAMSRVVVTV
jgi:hypothetical protein